MPHADPEAKLAYDRAYKAARRAELAAKQRAYYQRTRSDRDTTGRAYLDANPLVKMAVRFANGANRRARRWGAPGKLWARDLRQIHGPCEYCGRPQHGWDHVIPLCRGGANDISNLVPCCLDCNRAKARRTPDEWEAVWRPSQWSEVVEVLRRGEV